MSLGSARIVQRDPTANYVSHHDIARTNRNIPRRSTKRWTRTCRISRPRRIQRSSASELDATQLILVVEMPAFPRHYPSFTTRRTIKLLGLPSHLGIISNINLPCIPNPTSILFNQPHPSPYCVTTAQASHSTSSCPIFGASHLGGGGAIVPYPCPPVCTLSLYTPGTGLLS